MAILTKIKQTGPDKKPFNERAFWKRVMLACFILFFVWFACEVGSAMYLAKHPCYVSPYILANQELKTTELCTNCLYVTAYPFGAQTPIVVYFEKDHALLKAKQGDVIEMNWCAVEGGWFVKGVSIK